MSNCDKHILKPVLMLLALALISGFVPKAHSASDPEQKKETMENIFLADQNPMTLEYPIEYEDADIVQFVNDDLLLIGALKNDRDYLPVYGPLIMFDLNEQREVWRVERNPSKDAVHEIFSTKPFIILRTTLGSKVIYQAFDTLDGKLQWKYDHKIESVIAYGGYNSEGMINFYELSKANLLNISARNGTILWQSKIQTNDIGHEQHLVVTPGFVYVVGNRYITVYNPANGEQLWGCSQNIQSPFNTVMSLEGIFVYSAKQALAYKAEKGELLWTWKPKEGVIKMMTERSSHIYTIVQHLEKNRNDIIALDRKDVREIWRVPFSGYVASPLIIHGGMVYATVGYLEEKTMGMVDNPILMPVFTNLRDLVGLSDKTGEVSLNIQLPAHTRNPGLWFYPPLLDQIDIRGNLLLIARDDNGVMGVDRITGEIKWNQPIGIGQSTYNKGIQKLGLFDTDIKESYKPNGHNSFTSPQPSYQYSMMQANNEAHVAAANRVLNDPGASAADRDAARLSKQIYTSAEMNRMQISSSFQRTQTSVDLAMSIMALGNIFEQFRQIQVERAKAEAFYNGRFDIQIGIRQHNKSLSGEYCLLAYPQSVTIINLNNGERCDLNLSKVITPGHADKPTAVISPGGKWLAAVGINPNHGFSKSDVIIYDIPGLSFNND